MATSAFKSTTQRASLTGGSSAPKPSASSHRRSRSQSRPHRTISEPDYANAPRGKFVNTRRGTATPTFTEISLDDLALEFFSDSQSSNSKNDSSSLVANERKGRSVSRQVERWASDTASSSSRRRVRSVSRTRGSGGDRDAPAVSGRGTNVNSSRRRSLSVARYQISDSESDVDHSRNSSNRVNPRAPASGNNQMHNTKASSNRRLSRTQSQKDLSRLHNGYSSHSSALTDDEYKDTRVRKNGFEKITRAVYAKKKAEHPPEDVADTGLYEIMRKELRYAVEEIRTEINQTMVRNQTGFPSDDFLDNYEAHPDFSNIQKEYGTKFNQDQRGREGSRIDRELADSRTFSVGERRSRSRKRSSDRGRMSNLTEEAEKYIEEFISNLEDTDITSFDGEISDGSSTFGGSVKTRNSAKTAETVIIKTPEEAPTSRIVEMDGVILPWLKWETSHDASLTVNNNSQTPMTTKSLQWDPEKDVNLLLDPSTHSISSRGSWSPGVFCTPLSDKREGEGKRVSSFSKDDYLKLQKSEDLLFEMYRERNRIGSGGLLLCTGGCFC